MPPLTYRKAGVDIDAADRFVNMIKPLIRTTGRPEVLGAIGGFGGLFRPRLKGMKRPVLVSSTDGVGTKLLIADLLGKYDTIGIDLVAMCVNDIVVLGAEPLFFLDYIAVGKVRPRVLVEVMKGIVKGCRQARCALLGGETAELPGLYTYEKWDLAGFCVGLVDEAKIVDGRKCRPGDAVVGLASNGLHSNGYSLARRVFPEAEIRSNVGRELLRPTRIYSPLVLELLKKIRVKALAHITGGGLIDNVPRVLPEGLGARIDKASWPVPRIFQRIREAGGIQEREMSRTFNMGIGMALVVSPGMVDKTVSICRRMGQKAWRIGEIVKGNHEASIL